VKTARQIPKPAGFHWDLEYRVIRPDGFKSCRWCKGPVKPPRRTFCGSPLCLFEWQRRTSWKITRQAVYERASGICSGCPLDLRTVDLQRFLTQLKLSHRAENRREKDWRKWKPPPETDASGNLYPRAYWLREIDRAMEWKSRNRCIEHNWEVDHVVPVSIGGDWFEWENLCLLCLPCHKLKTRREATQRGRRRPNI
jgi:5-methylcytosine-specific restriction endonuclease McrA